MYEQKKKLGYIQTVPIQLLYIHWIPVMRESCQKKKIRCRNYKIQSNHMMMIMNNINNKCHHYYKNKTKRMY